MSYGLRSGVRASTSIDEEHRMLNWIKHNRKLMNAGELKLERLEMFRE